MDVALFNFPLPDELIALRPAVPRRASRLLHIHADGPADRLTVDLPKLLRAGDVLVFNNAAVVPARLYGRVGERMYEILPSSVTDDQNATTCAAFIKKSARLKIGDRIAIDEQAFATVTARNDNGTVQLQFSEPLLPVLYRQGRTPLPPYILKQRPDDAADRDDYQTVAAAVPAAVAASTAGLHFDEALLNNLRNASVSFAYITLHVGAGTFTPVKVTDTKDHVMHAEHAVLDAQTVAYLNDTRAAGGRIIAVGTTALRTLESAADDAGVLHAFNAPTDLFITPGYRFKAVDLLLTNLHPPCSTPLMLTTAFSGYDRVMQAYQHAITAGYRWCSYGDFCLAELQ